MRFLNFSEHLLVAPAVVVGDVDCTVEKALCSTYDVKGFPTLKWFAAGSDTPNEYDGGRTLSDLKTFAEGNLGPQCGSRTRTSAPRTS